MLLADFNAGDSLQNAFTEVVAFLPNVIGALLILLIGYFVAKVLGGVVDPPGPCRFRSSSSSKARWRVDTAGGSSPVQPRRLHRLLGIFLGAISIAVDVLGIEALENFVAAITATCRISSRRC